MIEVALYHLKAKPFEQALEAWSELTIVLLLPGQLAEPRHNDYLHALVHVLSDVLFHTGKTVRRYPFHPVLKPGGMVFGRSPYGFASRNGLPLKLEVYNQHCAVDKLPLASNIS